MQRVLVWSALAAVTAAATSLLNGAPGRLLGAVLRELVRVAT